MTASQTGPSPGDAPVAVTDRSRRRRGWTRFVGLLGWTLVAGGVVILLYLAYVMFYTNLVTDRAQGELLERWELDYGAADEAVSEQAPPAESGPSPTPVEVGDAYAVMWFQRPGSDVRPVHADPLFVVEGVDLETLKQGPGHYPGTAGPGQPGNFALAGHRTTYGAPFYHLDQLRAGDEIHVVDRQRRPWVYEVTDTRVVHPDETWVVGPDPLQTGEPVLSLTTCEPRFSAAKRLIVFAELRAEAS